MSGQKKIEDYLSENYYKQNNNKEVKQVQNSYN